MSSRHPEIKWAQRKDVIFITVQLPDSKNAKVDLDPNGVFTFSAHAGSGDHLYEVKLELFDKVNVEESKINYGVRSIFCILEKVDKVWWNKLLRGGGKPPHYVKVDWDKWVDEDEENGSQDLDLGGMDFSKFGDMGGLGGMGGLGDMGGMGGMDEFEDSEDEEEVAKPTEAHADKAVGAKEGQETEGAAVEETK